jgi:hypothetical protein
LEKVTDGSPAEVNDSCRFIDTQQDKVGRHGFEKDGIKDNHVRISGLDTQKKIAKILITAPENGRWESTPPDGHFWRVVSEKNGEHLDCFFSPYTSGKHTFSISFEDGSSQNFVCFVPSQELYFRGTFVTDSPIKVFRYAEKDFNAMMLSVGSGILEKETRGTK